MLRSEINNELLKAYTAPSYLELGVWKGDTFHAVNASRKVAVDPLFLFDVEKARAGNANCEYYQMTSDEYFSQPSSLEHFDLIFIDGLHTFEQALKDLLHSIVRLRQGGLIVVDDVIPDSYESSLHSHSDMCAMREARGDPSRSWMGDVFRVVFFIEAFLLDFSYCTVQENHGQLVLWRNARRVELAQDARLEQVARRDFLDVFKYREIFNIKPLEEIRRLIFGA
jgi:hypothetical protein